MSSSQIYPIIVPTKSNLRSYNFYLTQSDGKIFLIDAGIDSETSWSKLTDQLSQNNLDVSDLDAIILTHHHADHIGLVNRIRENSDISLFAHPKAFSRLRRAETFLENRIEFFEKLYKKMGCGKEADIQIKRLQEAVSNNESQAINGDIQPLQEGASFNGFSINEVPGHAADHIVLVDEKNGILFGGDMVIHHSSTNALIDLGENHERTTSLLQYEQSLLKLRSLSIQVLYPGHGESIRNPYEVIDQKLHRIDQKAERVLSHVTTASTAAEIAKQIYRARYETLFPLVMSEVIGHLDRLVSLEKLVMEEEKGVIYYENSVKASR